MEGFSGNVFNFHKCDLEFLLFFFFSPQQYVFRIFTGDYRKVVCCDLKFYDVRWHRFIYPFLCPRDHKHHVQYPHKNLHMAQDFSGIRSGSGIAGS